MTEESSLPSLATAVQRLNASNHVNLPVPDHGISSPKMYHQDCNDQQ